MQRTSSSGQSNLGHVPLYEEDEDAELSDEITHMQGGKVTAATPRSTSVSFAKDPSSSRIPASGAGTRTCPRAIPKSSSSLRHIHVKSRTTSLGASLPEDRDLGQAFSILDPTDSAAGRQVDLERRRKGVAFQDQDTDDSDLDGSDPDQATASGDYFSRRSAGEKKGKRKAKASIPIPNGFTNFSSSSEHSDGYSDDDGSDHQEQHHLPRLSESKDHARLYSSGQKHLAPNAALHAGGLYPPLNPATPYVATPGPVFPSDLNTPVELTPSEMPIVNVQQRMEWQTMLGAVLDSEVLKSETKRINSVDTPDLTRSELSYQRWLDIRATLRGRGNHRGAIEEEEKRLLEGWAKMVRELVEEVKQCRAEHIEAAAQREVATADGQPDEDVEMQGKTEEEEVDTTTEDKQKVLEEVGSLLDRIDSAEEQFPSNRKVVEVVPDWGAPEVLAKLEDLYSWYNVTTSLRLQINILRKWTGSETLEIAEHRQRGEIDAPQEDGGTTDHHQQQHHANPNGAQEVDDSTFVERIQKEGSLQSTFEKRTLSSLYQLISKAKETILERHESFRRMALPSFEPELVTLINFPTRLMQGALKLRLDYAGKLSEPSVLIVDSLTDDLRTALAMACRVKLQYTRIIVPIPQRGWDLASCIAEGYDDVLRDALKFFFRLLRMKLKASIFFKETEILEPEWRFLSTAVESIEGGDTIVASNITQFVNKLFKRISRYFNRELAATFSKSKGVARRLPNAATGPVGLTAGDQSASTEAKNLATLEERAKWIHSVFDNVRIRSRKLLGFARDIRNRLDNAAEYDLASLRPAIESVDPSFPRSEEDDPAQHAQMDLAEFMQTLIDADYFLVYTESLEEKGIYLIAEPSLQDKPELIGELLCKCLHPVRPSDEETAMAAEANANVLNTEGEANADADEAGQWGGSKDQDDHTGSTTSVDDERPRYLLLLSPRDPFMWTGKVMHHIMPKVDITLADRKVRLVADGPKGRLELCKQHFRSIFASQAGDAGDQSRRIETTQDASDDGVGGFPLELLNDHMAHTGRIQSGLEDINKGVYLLSDTIIRKVPEIRRRLRGISARHARKSALQSSNSENPVDGAGGDCDELIQNCYSMAAEQGRRALPFIESVRLRNQMTLALGRLAIDWVAFICDDCVPSERKTFKWAVSALGNANYITSSENIFHLSEEDFALLRSKVASCMALLISHFDILGARSSVAQAQAEQERLERERAERDRIAGSAQVPTDELQIYGAANNYGEVSSSMKAGLGVQSRFNKLDTAMQSTEDRWVLKVREWDQARHEVESEQRLVGRVLDDTRLEDRSLQFLAQSASKITIRWQQGQFIGGGTFGTVYLAFNLDSGGLMAVKEIRFQDISSTPGLYKQIKDEMQVMSMLSHPNIVEYYGIEVHRDRVYIFEEYCQGGSLAALLEHGRIEDETVMQVYTLQMLDGLVYLHSKGIVHRDIKPDNILLDHMGVIKFVDFGAAKVLAKNSRTIQRSRRLGVVGPGLGGPGMIGPDGKPTGAAAAMQSLQGTPMYMSPEVIKGENRGRRGAMDIWSLGCVVLEFATGKRPWSQLDNEWAIMFHIGMAQQHPPLPEPSQLSELGIDFIRQCLDIDPYERPSATEMREHAWIRSFVDELNAANAAELELDTPEGTTGTTPSLRSVGLSSISSSAAHTEASHSHAHPGYNATIADMQYRKEDAQRQAMLDNDSQVV